MYRVRWKTIDKGHYELTQDVTEALASLLSDAKNREDRFVERSRVIHRLESPTADCTTFPSTVDLATVRSASLSPQHVRRAYLAGAFGVDTMATYRHAMSVAGVTAGMSGISLIVRHNTTDDGVRPQQDIFQGTSSSRTKFEKVIANELLRSKSKQIRDKVRGSINCR